MTIDIIIPATAVIDSVPLDIKLFILFFLLGLIVTTITIGTGLAGHPIGIIGIMLFGLSFFCLGYFISGSGDKRGHGKTPLFMAGMKCLPLCKVPLLSAANNCVQPIDMILTEEK